jgi:secondary thiamine-phosphate synthase enzyme
MAMLDLNLETRRREEFVDITEKLRDAIRRQGFQNGAVVVFCPHTTAGLTINEGADPDVKRDLTVTLDRLVPERGDYRHAEGNSDAHLKASLMGASLLVPVVDGNLQLGTWQAVYFCEFDGPRSRKVKVQFLPG